MAMTELGSSRNACSSNELNLLAGFVLQTLPASLLGIGSSAGVTHRMAVRRY